MISVQFLFSIDAVTLPRRSNLG